MKQYHTSISINASIEKVWQALTDFKTYPEWNPIVGKLEGTMREGEKISTFIVPLQKIYFPTLLSYKNEREIVWQGVQGTKFLLAGKHYYRLEKLSINETKLLHGEYFTGILCMFISDKTIQKMKNAFIKHNQILKQRVEYEG